MPASSPDPASPAVVDAAHAALARATARELAIQQAYDRARNVLRARERRRALTPPTRTMLSTPGRLDAVAGSSTAEWAWGVPVWRRGQLLAVISPTAGAVTTPVRVALRDVLVVVAGVEEQERIRRVTDRRQRFVLLSVRVREPAHGEVLAYARTHPAPGEHTR